MGLSVRFVEIDGDELGVVGHAQKKNPGLESDPRRSQCVNVVFAVWRIAEENFGD